MKWINKLVIFSLLVTLLGCSTGKKYDYYNNSFTGPFDTIIEYRAYCLSQDEFDMQLKLIKEELTKLDQLFDRYTSYEGINNIKTINDQAGVQPVEVDPILIDLLEKSIQYNQEVCSKVDIMMGSVLSLWHDARERAVEGVGEVPSISQLEEANKHTDISLLEIDDEKNTVYIRDSKASIDVGATAKGYAIEYVKQKLIEQGATAFLLSGGGNIASYGMRQVKAKGNENLERSQDEFLIGIESPGDGNYADGQYPAMVIATNQAIVTSGDYQRNFKDSEGNVYHHLIDPDTLFPATYFRSVTILTENSGYADFLSSAAFLLPYDQSYDLIENLDGVEAVWLMNDGTINHTTGLKEGDNFHITNRQ